MMQGTPRENLPWRRAGIAVTLKCELGGNERLFDAHFNFYADGRLAECFCKPCKTGSELEPLLDKFCIVLSIALQHGAEVHTAAKAVMGEAPGRLVNIFDAIMAAGAKAQADVLAEIAAGGA